METDHNYGRIGKNADGFKGVYRGRGFGRRNLEGERILKFAVACYDVTPHGTLKD